ncbi:MAG: type II toxin-antitoxin system VapC family toxin [Nanoarchaeota archaeon]|nr:type II toxin-antitoxin system VapC family toxin [Nanoarchaeota archaeon]
MTLAFDTSILIAIERKNKPIIIKLRSLSKLYPIPAQLPFMCYYEFLQGLKIRKPKRQNNLMNFINHFNTLHTTRTTAEILSDLKLKYNKQGIQLSLTDLLIASQVIENHLTLVTMDKDFENITELRKIIL